MSYSILLVEDNPHIMDINSTMLMMEGYQVLKAEDGRSCMDVLKTRDVDMIVLDIMLPDADGLALCRVIKERYDVPILFLSALGENEHIIHGFKAGGDDYLPKPYDIDVLLARIEARLRDSQTRKRFVSCGGLNLDTFSMSADYEGKDLLLTQKEFVLLLKLTCDPGRLIDKEELYRSVWGASAGEDYRTIYTTVSRLNKKMDTAGAKMRVIFRRGEGYMLEDV